MEKAAELGAAVLQPLVCERLQGQQARGIERRRERWARKAAEAARQSGRGVVTEIGDALEFEDFLREPAAGLRLLASREDSRTLWQALEEIEEAPPSVVMAVGPAGGFTRREREAAVGAGFRPVSLGPNTLRVETAAICLLAAVAFWLEARAGQAT